MSGKRDDIVRRWMVQTALVIFTVYFYVFMEWLFFLTKPSFLSRIGFADSLYLFLITPAPFGAAALVLIFLVWTPALLTGNRIIERAGAAAGTAVIVLALTAALFLLVDNFTYTVLRFGVRMADGAEKLAYLFLLVVMAVFLYQTISELYEKLLRSSRRRVVFMAALSILIVSVLAALLSIDISEARVLGRSGPVEPLKRRPNFLVLSIDGLNADHLSAYGYERDTTPFLRGLAQDALFCENGFVNADASSGSIVSILTGKLPTQTRVIYAPDILRGGNSYEHLPGILKRHGYRNIDISMRHHADPVDLNMRNAFEWVNFREIGEDRLADLSSLLHGGQVYFFIVKMRERIGGRLFHIFGLDEMEDPMAEVAPRKTRYSKDSERIGTLLSLLDVSRQPFFAHVHLVGTHGPTFNPVRRIFSAGKKQTEPWMTDFYDDAILNVDSQLREIVEALRIQRLSSNTVIVICTDHGRGWVAKVRVPLMFVFPYGEHARRIPENVQNLDIAPTILDYLGIERPDWMSGESLLASRIDPDRYIFMAGRLHRSMERTREGWKMDETKMKPPFHSLGSVGAVYCHRMYELDLETGALTVIDIKGHTSPCDESEMPDPREMKSRIVTHLEENGYDTSSIKTPL